MEPGAAGLKSSSAGKGPGDSGGQVKREPTCGCRCVSGAHRERVRDHGHQLEHKKFHLKIGKVYLDGDGQTLEQLVWR